MLMLKYSDIQQVLTSALEHREFPQDTFLEYNPSTESLLSFNLISEREMGKKHVENMIRML